MEALVLPPRPEMVSNEQRFRRQSPPQMGVDARVEFKTRPRSENNILDMGFSPLELVFGRLEPCSTSGRGLPSAPRSELVFVGIRLPIHRVVEVLQNVENWMHAATIQEMESSQSSVCYRWDHAAIIEQMVAYMGVGLDSIES